MQSLEEPSHRLDNCALLLISAPLIKPHPRPTRTDLLRDARQSPALVTRPRIPFRAQGVLEPFLVLLHTGVRIRQVFDLILARLLVLLLADDDVREFCVLALRLEQARRGLEELGVRLALLRALARPRALDVSERSKEGKRVVSSPSQGGKCPPSWAHRPR